MLFFVSKCYHIPILIEQKIMLNIRYIIGVEFWDKK